MRRKHLDQIKEQHGTIRNDHASSAFNFILGIMIAVIGISVIFLIFYKPKPTAPAQPVTLEQKLASIESGAPLPQQNARPDMPWWMMAMIFSFVVIQILPVLLASHKARAKEFSRKDLREIEYLAETPLHLGLLGSLIGVCLTHFLSGSLAAPMAYLTTISGILMYLVGRFTILVSLPSIKEFR